VLGVLQKEGIALVDIDVLGFFTFLVHHFGICKHNTTWVVQKSCYSMCMSILLFIFKYWVDKRGILFVIKGLVNCPINRLLHISFLAKMVCGHFNWHIMKEYEFCRYMWVIAPTRLR
jgi:hypothetical protein